MSGDGHVLQRPRLPGGIPLWLPAVKAKARDEAVFVRPWFARGSADAGDDLQRPVIATSTTTDFIPAFLAAVGRSSAGLAPDAWEGLVPFRDWAEPPRAMLTADASPNYPTAGADAIVRAAPRPNPIDASAAATAGDGGWLRKLYLPLHLHFHVVACELICRHPGAPPIAARRVIASGLVVRRLKPGAAKARWEDWVPSGRRTGLWQEIADGEMIALGGALQPAPLPGANPHLPLDPVGLERMLDPALAGELKRQLGLAAGDAVTLDSARLAPLPPGLGATRHTVVYGYLPVQIGELLATGGATLTASQLDAARLATASAIQSAALTAVQGRADALRLALRAPLAALLERLIEAPLAPLIVALAGTGSVGFGSEQVAVDVFVRRLCDWYGLEDQSPSLSDFLFDRIAHVPGPDHPVELDAGRRRRILDLFRVRREAAFPLSVTDPSSLPSGVAANDRVRLVLVLVRAVRRQRWKLLQGVSLGDHAPALVLTAPATDPLVQRRTAPASAGTMGEQIETMLAAESARADGVLPYPPPLALIAGAGAGSVHRLARTLEDLLAGIEDLLLPAGDAYLAALAGYATTVRATLASPAVGFDEAYLLRAGIHLDRQPEIGLLLFPGTLPTESGLATMIGTGAGGGALAAAYTTPAPAAEALQEFALQPANRPALPRYDSDSIYAVWCWARIAPSDPCAEPQLVWSRRSEAFQLADPMDVLGIKPATIRMPDIPKLIRDIPRMRKARAKPFAAFVSPRDSGLKTGPEPEDTQREWGVAFICSFGIPVITIVAMVIFNIIFSILIAIPGFMWMLFLKFCIPIPVKK